MTKKENLLMLTKLNLVFAASSFKNVLLDLNEQGEKQDHKILELSDVLIQAISNYELIIKKLERDGVAFDEQEAEKYASSHTPSETIAEMLRVLLDLWREFYQILDLQDISLFIYIFRYTVLIDFASAL